MPNCPTCSKKFGSPESLLQHQRDSANHPWCKSCERAFGTPEAYKKHKDSAHSPGHSYKCGICSRSFSSMNGRDNHIIAVHDPSFECTYCDRFFHTDQGRMNHISTAHRNKCSLCSRIFAHSEDLGNHMMLDHTFRCSHCDRNFLTVILRDAHIASVHIFICSYCDATFQTGEDRDGHTGSVHSFPCSHCDTKYPTEEERDTHTASVHNFACQYCDSSFNTEDNRQDHIDASHCVLCSRCLEIFRTEDDLEAHRSTVHNCSCTICARSFGTAVALRVHSNTLHPYCIVCGVAFPSDQELLCHIKDAHGVPKIQSAPFSPTIRLTSPELVSDTAVAPVFHTPPTSPLVPSISIDDSQEHHSASKSLEDLTLQDEVRDYNKESSPVETEGLGDSAIAMLHEATVAIKASPPDYLELDAVTSALIDLNAPTAACISEETVGSPVFSPVVVSESASPVLVDVASLDGHNSPGLGHMASPNGSNKDCERRPDSFNTAAYKADVDTEISPLQERFSITESLIDVQPPEIIETANQSEASICIRTDLLHISSEEDQHVDWLLTTPASATTITLHNYRLVDNTSLPASPYVPNSHEVTPLPAVLPLPPSPSSDSASSPEDAFEITGSQSSSEPVSPMLSSPDSFVMTLDEDDDSEMLTDYQPDDDFVDSPLEERPRTSIKPLAAVFVPRRPVPLSVKRSKGRSKLPAQPEEIQVIQHTSHEQAGAPDPAISSQNASRLHCRICRKPECDDLTATMCGHLFCNGCITDAVIKTPRCPVCNTATLLYCLFKLDLSG